MTSIPPSRFSLQRHEIEVAQHYLQLGFDVTLQLRCDATTLITANRFTFYMTAEYAIGHYSLFYLIHFGWERLSSATVKNAVRKTGKKFALSIVLFIININIFYVTNMCVLRCFFNFSTDVKV